MLSDGVGYVSTLVQLTITEPNDLPINSSDFFFPGIYKFPALSQLK